MKSSQIIRGLRPGDPILVLALVGLALYGWFGPVSPGETSGRTAVRIISGSAPTLILDPDTTCVVEVDGPLGKTKVELDGGRVRIVDSPCPHRLCVRMGAVDRPGKPIVCLPNGVLVELVGGGAEVDGTTR